MEMPDVIYVRTVSDKTLSAVRPDSPIAQAEWSGRLKRTIYHHDRIVEDLKAENAELKNSIEILSQKLRDYSKAIDRLDAKLEKAKDIIIDMEKSDDAQAFKEARKFIDTHCSRTTLEELTKK